MYASASGQNKSFSKWSKRSSWEYSDLQKAWFFFLIGAATELIHPSIHLQFWDMGLHD